MTSYTEEEARKKYCPHRQDTCVTTSCLAWQFEPEPPERFEASHTDRYADKPTGRPADVPASYVFRPCVMGRLIPARWVEPEQEVQARWRGYCGAFGKPEFAG